MNLSARSSLPARVAAALFLLAAAADAASQWPPPDEEYTLDFRSEDSGAEPAFLDEGVAREIALDFLMIKHGRVTIRARLPERTRFEVAPLNPNALADLIRKEPTVFEVVAKVKAMSRTDVDKLARDRMMKLAEPHLKEIRAEANKMSKDKLIEFLDERKVEVPKPKDKKKELEEIRKVYVDLRTVDAVAPDLRRRLEEIAAAHPAWVPEKDQLAWAKARPAEIRDDCFILTGYEIMDEHLKRCGLGFDSNIPGYRRRLESRIDAAHVVMAGRAGEDPVESASVSQALGMEDADRLRAALAVKLRCRAVDETDPEDPNAQWFHAQRVACPNKRVPSIRIEGELDPAGHDRVDWWFLDGYNPAMVLVKADENPAIEIGSPMICDGGARLRIVGSGKKPVGYAVELHAVGAGQSSQKVLIYESPTWAGAKFPY